MRSKRILFPTLLLISLLFSSCSGMFLPLEDEPVTGEFGPAISAQEHQARTFDELWKNLETSYIYFETADLDWAQLRDEYTSRIDSGLTDDEFAELLKGLESKLPAGSFVYQSREQRVEADISDVATYDGIGAFIGFRSDPTPRIVLLAVIAGSPAEEAGLKAHDSILSIDGEPVTVEEGLTAANRIRGTAGTSVQLEIQSPGGSPRTVEVDRAKVGSTGKLEASAIPGTAYGYMLFPPIGYQGLDEDVFNNLQEMNASDKLEGLVLDLRAASSSRGWPLEVLLTMFHDGEIGEFYNRSQEQMLKVAGQDVFGSQSIPLVILVGEHTAGFSEIFAASLQMDGRASIVGAPTIGAVETQSAFYLPDGSRIFVESTSFRLSNGVDVGNNGVTPDVQVEAGWDEVTSTNDPVLDQALEILGDAE